MGRVLGADACRSGWVGVCLSSKAPTAWFGTAIAGLVAQVTNEGPLDAVAIDIPIGLPTDDVRAADAAARRMLGRRGAAVFTTLVRQAYEADDYTAASAAQLAATGQSATRQAYGLRAKILDVDEWLSTPAGQGLRVVECHPEISFMAMNDGSPVAAGKKTWSGVMRRMELLTRQGIDLDGDLGRAGREGAPDDVLDAAAAAWTARRFAVGMASVVPTQLDKPRDTAVIHY